MAEGHSSDTGSQKHDTSSDETTPDLERVTAEGKNRRDFLKAAVVASAAVAAAGAAAGTALAVSGKPAQLFGFGGNQASGKCISLSQGSKFSPNNPNNFLQVNAPFLSEFGTTGADDPDGDPTIVFTRCGDHAPIFFTLTDKNDANLIITGELVEFTSSPKDLYSHQGTNTDLYLVYLAATLQGAGPDPSKSLGNQFPEGSCLTLSCTA
jgi:hypothetical protein